MFCILIHHGYKENPIMQGYTPTCPFWPQKGIDLEINYGYSSPTLQSQSRPRKGSCEEELFFLFNFELFIMLFRVKMSVFLSTVSDIRKMFYLYL